MSELERISGARLPPGLGDLTERPTGLYLRGQLPPGPWVAVVGTRRPTDPACAFTRRLVADLVAAGVSIASGGALGIDACAHRAALDFGAGTVVVNPAGLERLYPDEHAELFREITLGSGALLSEVEPDVPARRHAFFRRNALLVAMSAALVVVQAPLRSGARNAAAWARRLGRPLFAVPHAPWEEAGRGCIEELKLGATPLTSARQLVRALRERGHACALPAPRARLGSQGDEGPARPEAQAAFAFDAATLHAPQAAPVRPLELSDVQALVLDALASAPASLDQVLERSRLSISEVRCSLLELCLLGVVQELEDGRYAPSR